MAFINVAEWTPENVAQWLQGLEDCILPYVHFFLNNQINGCRLLLLSPEDLTKLNVTKIGHQEIILDGVDLLKHLHYNFNSETLQSLALRLGCKSRSLYNQLKQEEEELCKNSNKNQNSSIGSQNSQNNLNRTGTFKGSQKESKNSKNNSNTSNKNSAKNDQIQSNASQTNSTRNKVSTKTLFGVCDILNAAKTFISWIDRYPFEGQEIYVPIRKTILKLSIELATTAQRDSFVKTPNDIILTDCLTFASLCDRIVQDLHDSLAIQPASLDVALIKKRSNEELGMHIHSSYSGIHIISGIKLSSATNNCGRIDEGDEIVQVNYRTVVGWQLRKLVDIMKEYQTELILTLKKRPKHCNMVGQVNVIKPFKLPLKEYSNNQKEFSPLSGSMTLKPIKPVKPRKPLPNEYSNEYTNIDQLKINNFSQLNASNSSLNKSKSSIRRRATISGSTSSLNFCGAVRVDDLLIKHEIKQYQQKQQNDQMQENSNTMQSDNSQNLPFAKVQPIKQNEESTIKQTVPKQLSTFSVTSTENGKKTIATIKSSNSNQENIGIVLPNTSRNEQLKLSTFQQENNNNISNNNLVVANSILNNVPTLPAPTCKPPPIPSRNNNFNPNSSLNSSTNNQQTVANEKPVIPMRPSSISSKSTINQQQLSTIQLNRFVTLKQIEEENALYFKQNPTSSLCQLINNSNSSTNNNNANEKSIKECNNLLSGWLYAKREHFNTLLNANAKWSAKYIQLSTNYQLYAFKNELANKADLVINLAAFKVSPACECKSKENVFKIFNKHVIFLFACDTQAQMRQWVDTLRQLVANCASTKPDLMRLSSSPDVACYSETEDEEDVIDDEMMLQNFANELVETNKLEEANEETIESKIDIIKEDVIVKVSTNDYENSENIKPIKIISSDLNSTPISKNNEQLKHSNDDKIDENEDNNEEKHNSRMMRLLNRRQLLHQQRLTSTADSSIAESYRDSSPSSTSSTSSSANTSANNNGQVVLSRFKAISELKARLQAQAQEKLEQRRLALASGKKMFERSASCMDASTIMNLQNRLAAAATSNSTNNTPIKSSLVRNKSGSQSSLLSPTSNDVFNLSNTSSNNGKPELAAKPFYMTNKNKVLPSIPPRPPKPSSISVTNNTNDLNKSTNDSNNLDELNKRSQPLPQPRTSKNFQTATVEQLAVENFNNKENINLTNNLKSSESNILKKTLTNNQKVIVPNHKDNEYISNIIDELYNFEETKPEPVIAKPILQTNQLNQQNNQHQSELSIQQAAFKKHQENIFNRPNDFQNLNENSMMINHKQSTLSQINNQFNGQFNNQFNNNQLNCQLNDQQYDEEDDEELDDEELTLSESEIDDSDCLSEDEKNYNSNLSNNMFSGNAHIPQNNHPNLNAFAANANLETNNMNNMNNMSNMSNMGNMNNMNNMNNMGNMNNVNNMNNLFSFNGNNNSNLQTSNDVNFMAPGPNFLSGQLQGLAPELNGQSNAYNQVPNNLLNNDPHHDNHLSISSNSNNNYPTSSTNSFNISPYSSISQHNNQQINLNLPNQTFDNNFNNQLPINQLNDQFSTMCNLNTEEQLSDCSSGVGSYVSQFEKYTNEYLEFFKTLQYQQLQNHPPEIRDQIIQQFEANFKVEFQRQIQTQLLHQQQQQLQQTLLQQNNAANQIAALSAIANGAQLNDHMHELDELDDEELTLSESEIDDSDCLSDEENLDFEDNDQAQKTGNGQIYWQQQYGSYQDRR